MTTDARPGAAPDHGFRNGILGHLAILLLVALGVLGSFWIAGGRFFLAAVITCLSVLLALDLIYLIVILILVAVAAVRGRFRSRLGLLLGCLTGAAVIAGGFTALAAWTGDL